MAKWTDSKQNKDIIAQLTAAREDINVIAKSKIEELHGQAVSLAMDVAAKFGAKAATDLAEAKVEIEQKIMDCKNILHSLVADTVQVIEKDAADNGHKIAETNMRLDASKNEIHNMLAELSKNVDIKNDISKERFNVAIGQQAKEIKDLRESMLELIENAECKVKAENKVIEQYNDCMFEYQAKQMKQLKIGLIIAIVINIGQIVYEIIK